MLRLEFWCVFYIIFSGWSKVTHITRVLHVCLYLVILFVGWFMFEIWALVTFDRGLKHYRWTFRADLDANIKQAKARVRIKPPVQNEQTTLEAQSGEQGTALTSLTQNKMVDSWVQGQAWREYKLPPKLGLPFSWDSKDLLPISQLSFMFSNDVALLNCLQVVYICEADANASICLCFLEASWPLAFLSLPSFFLILTHPYPHAAYSLYIYLPIHHSRLSEV